MASLMEFVARVTAHFDPKLGVTARSMFGEYGPFSGGRIFALICDDRLLFKPTPGGRAHIGKVTEAEPYPGAKPALLIAEPEMERGWLSALAWITLRELPPANTKPAQHR